MSSVDNSGNTGLLGFLWGVEVEDEEEKVQDDSGDQVDIEHDESACVDVSCPTRANGQLEDVSNPHDESTCFRPDCTMRPIREDAQQSSAWARFWNLSGGGQYCVPTDFTSHVDEMRTESPLKRSGSTPYEMYEQTAVYVQGDGEEDNY